MTHSGSPPTDGTSGTTRPVRVLLADGQQLLRSGLRTVLGGEPDVDVVAEAADGTDAVALTRRLLPDVVVMDVRMPRLDGVAATETITGQRLPVRVLLLTTDDSDEAVVGALRAGATGLLAKDLHAADLVAAIRAVAAGEAVVAPSVLQRLLDRFAATLPAPQPQVHGLEALTEREREVLAHVGHGESNQEIAHALQVGETTVKTHVGNVLTKLALRDRAQAVVAAYESGLVRPGHTGPGRTPHR